MPAEEPKKPASRGLLHGAMSTNQRIRGRKLQAIRRRHFRDNPLCSGPDSACEREGRVTIWAELDHSQALGNGGSDDDSNRRGLCATCHAIKTAKDQGYKYRPKVKIGADGWPEGSGGKV